MVQYDYTTTERKEMEITLEQAISYHLSGNFYPPLPQAYVKPALEALEFFKYGEYEGIVYLPADLNPLPRKAIQTEDGEVYVSASDLVDALRLDSHKFGDFLQFTE